MPESLHTPESQIFTTFLVEQRKAAGLSQRELAEALGVVRSWVANVELGERRVDVVEFLWICEALDLNAAEAGAEVLGRMGKRK
ncbi:MAG: helix-turn-helix transcriptional regulator [Planctomycetota bacterium]